MSAKVSLSLCRKAYGRGMGGISRSCQMPAGHEGRCSDMPFLRELREAGHRRVAEKIERDAFNTRGASWGKAQDGKQARRNRQPRWTLKSGDKFYPGHYQTYENCVIIAAELALQAYEMVGAPICSEQIANMLPRTPLKDSGICLICRIPLEFSEFALAEQSKAAIDTDHLNPNLVQRHISGNVWFVHHICNTTKGDRSLEEFVDWAEAVVHRHRSGEKGHL